MSQRVTVPVVLAAAGDLEAFCGSCGPDGMGDWFPSAQAVVCRRCGEQTCPEHRRPRRHDCREMRELRALDQEVVA